jgi:hypothetical protein
MSKFKNALERGKAARSEQQQLARKEEAQRNAADADFNVQAKAWLYDIALTSLEAAKSEVADEVGIDIDTASLQAKDAIPSLQFRIYRTPLPDSDVVPRTFTVAIDISGAASVSAPGIVAKDAGTIADKSAVRFTTMLARLIEDVVANVAPGTRAGHPLP